MLHQRTMITESRHTRKETIKRAWAASTVLLLTLATCGLLIGVNQVFASAPASLGAAGQKGLSSDLSALAKSTPTLTATATPTVLPLAPTPLSLAQNSDTTGAARIQEPKVDSIPVFSSFDFMSGYFTNSTDATIVDGNPWDNGSTNFAQYTLQGGGNSYWDYWIDNEPWESPNHMWRDDQGQWHTYGRQVIQDATGKKVNAYVLVDRTGPGVMDKLWFTHNPVRAFLNIVLQKNLFFSTDPPEVTDWGSLSRLGNLRIEVDGGIIYDGPIESWFSGQAQNLPADLQKILVWRYGLFGSDGNIIPIPYQNHLKVYVYGGPDKPKWFMATGMTLPEGTRVDAASAIGTDLPLEKMATLAQNILQPEDYLQSIGSPQDYSVVADPNAPVKLVFQGSGTLGALQFKLPKRYDLTKLWMRVLYGDQVGVDLPLLAFFGKPDEVTVHHSTPVGIIDSGDSYLLYSNWPMPYQDGMQIELSTQGTEAIPIHVKAVALKQQYGTQLWALYRPPEKLQTYGPDYKVDIEGDGKMVGLVLDSGDQSFDEVPRIVDPKTGKEDASKLAWPMGYLEGNLAITDGAGSARYYSGQEDWAEGGYYFNSGYTVPPGGSNRPFGGILSYQGGKDGHATLFRYFNDLSAFRFRNGLHLSFGHGTWENNFPVSYSVVLFYYHQVAGATQDSLPASDYVATP